MSPRMGIDLKTVIQTAGQLADEEGLEAVTLATLAKKLSIRPPSLYNHIDGLTGLRNKIAVYGLQQLITATTHAAVGRSGDEAIRAIGKAYVEFARSHPGVYEATLRSPDPNDSEYVQVGGEVVALLVRVLEVYGLRDDQALHAVRCFRSLLHGFASIEQKGGFGMPLDLDVTLDKLLDMFIVGIRSQSTGNPH